MVEVKDRIRQICLRSVVVVTLKLGVAVSLEGKCIFYRELTESGRSFLRPFSTYSRIIGELQAPGENSQRTA